MHSVAAAQATRVMSLSLEEAQLDMVLICSLFGSLCLRHVTPKFRFQLLIPGCGVTRSVGQSELKKPSYEGLQFEIGLKV
jgi:hypothetical protein